MRTEGAFLIGAKMEDGKVVKIKIFSEKGSHLRIENNIAKAVLVKRKNSEEVISGEVIELSTHIGEAIILTPEPVEYGK